MAPNAISFYKAHFDCLPREEYFVTLLELGPAIEQHDFKR